MAEYTIDKIEYGDNVYKLQDSVSGYVSGGNVIPYLTCGTAAGTAAKTTTLVTGTLPATLTTGTRVAVKFTNSNSIANPTITIGSYGAIAIKRYGTTAPSTSAVTSWNAGNVITLVYDGTYWMMADWTTTNSTYSEISETNITSGSGTSTGLVSGRRAKAAVEAFESVTDVTVGGTTVVSGRVAAIPAIPTIPSNNVTGSGSTNYLARWSGTNTLSSTSLSISTSYNSSSDEYGTIKLYVGSTGQVDWKGQLVFYGGSSSNTITITPPNLTGNRTITLPNNTGTIALTSDIPTVPSNIVNTITTTAGTHTAITSQKGNVSFNVPTKTSHLTNDSGFITSAGVTSITTTAGAHTAITSSTGAVSFKVPTTAAHVGAATSDHTHGNITNGGDITATAPTIASGDQIIINDNSASKITNGPTFDGSTTTTALTPKGTWESFAKSDTNTTYALSGTLSSHKFTSTLTAGGSGSGTSTSDFTLAAGTGITITDDTSARKMTIACSVTNTDTKVSTAAVTSGTTYYPVLGSDTTSAATKFYDKSGISYVGTTGSGSTSGTATFTIGNNVAGSSGKCGYLDIYGTGQYKATLRLGSALTANRLINLPDKDGTIALTSDAVPKPSDDGTDGWILKTRGNNNTYWDAPNVYQFGIYQDANNPGTYGYYGGDIEDYIRDAFANGQNLALRLDLLNSINELDTYMLTDYHAEWISTDAGAYIVLWFTGTFKTTNLIPKKITVGIYLDESEIEHEYGEISVDVRELGERVRIVGGSDVSSTITQNTTNTWISLGQINLSPGRWIVTARARFVPTSSSNHYSAICISNETTLSNVPLHDRCYGEGTYYNQHSTSRIMSFDTLSTVYLYGRNSTTGTWPRAGTYFALDAVRIS